MDLTRVRIVELLAVVERHQPITVQQFAEAVFPPDMPVWKRVPKGRKPRGWTPGGQARSTGAGLLGKLRLLGMVKKDGTGVVFELTPAGREYLHRPISPVSNGKNGLPQPHDPRWLPQADGSKLLFDGRDYWTWPVHGGLFKWSDRGWIKAV